ncbi:hypothetical protein ACFQ1Q_11315 [Winogradskyella litorisediminis]|uniref:DUF2878 domain-containing protein n=1 Tax=Winogradskyella litorisediminis TaxID=1156618 RepID=A0ABW3N833_9FLAO
MKYLHKTNKIFTILGIGVSLTFWGAMIALPVLGLAQIIMCIIIFYHRKNLTKKTLKLFYAYVIATIGLAGTFKTLEVVKALDTLSLMFIWMFVSAGLAFFHLYVTYLINKDYEL